MMLQEVFKCLRTRRSDQLLFHRLLGGRARVCHGPAWDGKGKENEVVPVQDCSVLSVKGSSRKHDDGRVAQVVPRHEVLCSLVFLTVPKFDLCYQNLTDTSYVSGVNYTITYNQEPISISAIVIGEDVLL